MNKGWCIIRIMPNKKCETMKAKKNQKSYGTNYSALSPDRLPMQLGIMNSLICERFYDKNKSLTSYRMAQFLLKQDFDRYDVKS